MVGPGGDPHTYQPTTQDISKIKTSNVVLWSGLHMEAKMLDELADLGKFIAEKKIPTIFQDNLANPQAINSLKETVRAKGWNVEVSDKELYADSLGETAPTDTYIGVLKYNADAIKAALTK
ncbi:hypothetical protein AN398_00555 [Corynebacterium pseudotuberculosis]|nr:hypothetical protein AN398_00555 [Corynebacterium pseudotuberculosis]